MSKTIRLHDIIYDRLDQVRGKHETFSQVVNRLLDIRDGIVSMTQTLEGGLAYVEFKRQQLQKVAPVNAGANSAKVPDVLTG